MMFVRCVENREPKITSVCVARNAWLPQSTPGTGIGTYAIPLLVDPNLTNKQQLLTKDEMNTVNTKSLLLEFVKILH